MATPLHGRDGYAYVGGSAIGLVVAWTLTGGAAWDDITAMSSGGAREIVSGVKSWTGAITVRYATDDTVGQTILRANALGGTMVALRLYPSGTANYFSGSAGLSLDLNAAHNQPDEATYNFISHGSWQYT